VSRGIEVLGRVREIRERDSLIGLQRSTAMLLEHQRVAAAEAQRHHALPAVREGATTDFLVHRAGLARSAAVVEQRELAAHDSQVVTDEARRRWQGDRVKLRTIERLIERRAEARRAEIAHREVRALDEIAEQMHQRRMNEQRTSDKKMGEVA
jgi:flagellar FliJ protein